MTALTGGLSVSSAVRIRRVRRLPVPGEPLVAVGDRVTAEDAVAKASLPGELAPLDAAKQLGISPGELENALCIREGEAVSKGQVLAETRGLLGLRRISVVSPCDGTAASISPVSGRIVISKTPSPLVVRAYVSGRVSAVEENGTVEVEAVVSMVQGVFGVGGECYGRLMEIDSVVEIEQVIAGGEVEGAVVFSEAPLGYDSLFALRGGKAVAAICGAVPGADLVRFAGRTLNPACTGDEGLGMCIILTEGFGQWPMNAPALSLLRKLNGARVSAAGITQVRAGVIRPEILGPASTEDEGVEDIETSHRSLGVGDRVRIVRGRHFGRIGAIVTVPSAHREVGSGARALVYELTMSEDERLIVPRANVESVQ